MLNIIGQIIISYGLQLIKLIVFTIYQQNICYILHNENFHLLNASADNDYAATLKMQKCHRRGHTSLLCHAGYFHVVPVHPRIQEFSKSVINTPSCYY